MIKSAWSCWHDIKVLLLLMFLLQLLLLLLFLLLSIDLKLETNSPILILSLCLLLGLRLLGYSIEVIIHFYTPYGLYEVSGFLYGYLLLLPLLWLLAHLTLQGLLMGWFWTFNSYEACLRYHHVFLDLLALMMACDYYGLEEIWRVLLSILTVSVGNYVDLASTLFLL